MGERPEKMTLDRIDGTKGYSKENCRWVTQKEQCRNTTRNVYIEYKGETRALTSVCEELNLNPRTIGKRIRDGWDVEKALTIPVGMGRIPNSVHASYAAATPNATEYLFA